MPGHGEAEVLCVYTLGEFRVEKGDVVLSDESPRSTRVWELFKFLLSHRGKSFSPEAILEILWPNQAYSDPRRAFRTIVHRLRNLLADASSGGTEYIRFNQSCYSWNTNINLRVDADEFERHVKEAGLLAETDPAAAIEHYQEALSMYKGDYLPESAHSDWVLPLRHYYHRLYLEAAYGLVALLKKEKRYDQIAKVCERALAIEPLDEEIHLNFIEALLNLNQKKQAQAHYEYMMNLYSREQGGRLPETLKAVYNKIYNGKADVYTGLEELNQGVESKEEGAYFCTPDVFRALYAVEKRKAERSGNEAFVCLVTLHAPGEPAGSPVLKEAMASFQKVLQRKLRQSDAVSRWNDAQYVMLLQGLNEKQAETVLGRLHEQFHFPAVKMNFKLQPVLPPRN